MKLKLKLLVIFAALSLPAIAQNGKQDRYDLLRELDKRVKIEQIPATNIVSLNFRGNYSKHPEAYSKLNAYVRRNYATAGSVIGLYPEDPDVVPESRLTWKISLRVLPGKPNPLMQTIKSEDPFTIPASKDSLAYPITKLKAPEKPFVIEQLPTVTAVTLITDVAHLGKDGLAINAWITMNNYVLIGTTRTEFGSTSGKSQIIPVKIIVPVKKRTREAI
jgi:hypothetical protein